MCFIVLPILRTRLVSSRSLPATAAAQLQVQSNELSHSENVFSENAQKIQATFFRFMTNISNFPSYDQFASAVFFHALFASQNKNFPPKQVLGM